MTDTRPYIDQERSVAETWEEKAARGRAFLNSPPPEDKPVIRPRDESAQSRALRRVVAADAPDRRLAAPVTMAQMFLRFDATHELPHVVETETGRIVARFEKAGDVALFIGGEADRKTLPAEYVRLLAGGQS